jgi:hypothetical protein
MLIEDQTEKKESKNAGRVAGPFEERSLPNLIVSRSVEYQRKPPGDSEISYLSG